MTFPLTNAAGGAAAGVGVWRQALACLRPYRGVALLAVLAVAASSGVGLLQPLLVRGLIDDALPAGRTLGSAAPLLPYVAGLVLVPLAACLLGLAQDHLCSRIGLGVTSDLRLRLFRHLQKQSLRFFAATPAGEISARVSDDVAQVGLAITGFVPSAIGGVVQLAGTLLVLFCVSWPLALAACLVLPLFLLPARPAGRRRGR
jgi:ATP-binding cassette subfamily B protein